MRTSLGRGSSRTAHTSSASSSFRSPSPTRIASITRRSTSSRRASGSSRSRRHRRAKPPSTQIPQKRRAAPTTGSACSSHTSSRTSPSATSTWSTTSMTRSTSSRRKSGRARRRSSGDACASYAATCGRSAERSRQPETRCTRCSTAASSSTTIGRTTRRSSSPRCRDRVQRRLRQAAAGDRGARILSRLARGRPRLPARHDRKRPERSRQATHRGRLSAARADVHRRPLRPELPPHARAALDVGLLVVVGLDHRHDDRAARVLPLEALDLTRVLLSDPQTLRGVGWRS